MDRMEMVRLRAQIARKQAHIDDLQEELAVLFEECPHEHTVVYACPRFEGARASISGQCQRRCVVCGSVLGAWMPFFPEFEKVDVIYETRSPVWPGDFPLPTRKEADETAGTDAVSSAGGNGS